MNLPPPQPEPAPTATPFTRRFVLALLLFAQHGTLGLWAPLLGLHMQNLGFTVQQAATVFATLPVATILSPWLGGQIADRWMPAERFLIISHVLAAVILWVMAGLTTVSAMLLAMLAFALVFTPSLAISATVVFRHLNNVRDEYGGVRVWGTAGWIAAGLWMGLWLLRPSWMPGAESAALSDSLLFSAGLALVVAGVCLVIPPSPPSVVVQSPAILAALQMYRVPENRTLLAVSFLLALGLGFVYPLAQFYFRSLGIPAEQVAPLLTLGQIGEIAAFLLLAPCLRRFGLRTTFLIGAGFWVLRFAVWAWGGSTALSIALIASHGFAFAYVFGVGQLYVHMAAPEHARASAQSVLMIITSGFGVLLSNLLAGFLTEYHKLPDGTVDYRMVYLWPTITSLVAMVIFALRFSQTTPVAVPPAPTPAPTQA